MTSLFAGLYTPTGTTNSVANPAPAVSSVSTSYAPGQDEVSQRIQAAFANASASTGTSFAYLVQTAKRESNFDPQAVAKTTSATGLFQFVEQTWLETMKTSGAKYGLGQLAAQITQSSSGKFSVADPAIKQQILELRKDPKVASFMAGELSAANATFLTSKIGRTPTAGELYAAHFLGAKGAAQLINAAASTPARSAVDVFPKQAAANPSIFMSGGQAKTVGELYSNLMSKHLDLGTTLPVAQASQPAVHDATNTTSSTDPNLALGYGDNDTAAQRIATGFAVADATLPMQSLFRTDGSKSALTGAANRPSPPTAILALQELPQPSPALPSSSSDQGGNAPPVPVPRPAADNPTIGAIRGDLALQMNRVGPIDLGHFMRGDVSGGK